MIDDKPYQVPSLQAPIELHLEGNEASLPPPTLPLAPDHVRRYQTPAALEALLAEQLHLPAARVLVTAGGDDGLDRVFRALLQPDQTVVLTAPTFDMIERFARLARGRLVRVPWLTGAFPTTEFLAHVTADTGVMVVVTPNNPTGLAVPLEVLGRLSEAAPHATLLVDMAYSEFAAEDPTDLVTSLPNSVMIRTLSKAWGFAGLRVGYAVADVSRIAAMRIAGPPYPCAGPSLAMAAYRITYQRPEVDAFITQVTHERHALIALLKDLGAEPWASEANFVLARFPHADWVWRGLAGLGIAVRAFPTHPILSDTLRMTCPGEPAWFKRLTDGLQSVLRPQAILFDMDGVLADVSDSYRKAIIETAAHYKVTLTHADVSAAKAGGSANNDWDLTWRLLAERGATATLPEVTERFEGLYQGGLWTNERLLVEKQFLHDLARRYPVAIVTGRPRADAVRFLGQHGLSDVFQHLVCMEDAALKPDPAPVRKALEVLNVSRAWMVGDTPDDVTAARRAGVVPIGIPSPTDNPAELTEALHRAGAAVVLQRLSDLERYW
ncbi:MAG TPA: TIGR01548 family HAD-type hydrolase [Candidatus Xenobia bacterium]